MECFAQFFFTMTAPNVDSRKLGKIWENTHWKIEIILFGSTNGLFLPKGSFLIDNA